MEKSMWLVTLVNSTTPDIETVPSQFQEEVSRLISLWRDSFPPTDMDGYGDLEDFVEQALRLDTAVLRFGENNLYYTCDNFTATHFKTKENVLVSEIKDSCNRYGIIYKHHDMFNNPYVIEADAADAYMTTKTFHNNAGRRIQLCSTDVDGQVSLQNVIKNFYNDGIEDFMIKASRSKKGLWSLSMDEDSIAHLEDHLLDAMDWSLVSLGGIKDAFLVQEKIVMQYEYRLFVINHTIVTGAGCIEEHSPLNNSGLQFDDSLRKSRQDNSPVIKDVLKVNTLVSFGRKVVQEFASEQPEVKNYVLDVALDGNGSPLMVERNSYPNSGFYACQPGRVVEAL